jgi:HlyD family secretion protein
MTAAPEQAAAAATDTAAGSRSAVRRPRRRLGWLAAVGAAVLIAGAATLWLAGPFRPPKPPAGPGPDPTSMATVVERSLSSQTEVSGTLGYSGNYSVVVASGASQSSGSGQGSAAAGQGSSQSSSQPAGTFTALPAVGQVVRRGQSLYSVSGSPVALLYGPTPAYRSLSEGMSGSDVRELNANLIALGDATSAELGRDSDSFSAATASALDRFQGRLGVAQTGTLPLGQAVYLPSAALVNSVSATLGGPAQAGAAVLQATSLTRQVTAQLDATEQSDVKAGQHVSITLPDNQTTPGVVTSVGTVASDPSGTGDGGSGSSSAGSTGGGSGSGSSAATINVYVKPADPAALGPLDQAPVQVAITTATVDNALVVPIDALLAEPDGYAVEVAAARGARRLVPVELGLFDDADGLVQVTGTRLSAGQRVVVPQI